MFENLTEKLQRTFKNLRGQGKLTEEHLDAALAEIREAMLEGDVALSVVDELLANIRSKALGSEVELLRKANPSLPPIAPYAMARTERAACTDTFRR